MIHINQSQIEIPWWILGVFIVYLILWVWSLAAVLIEKRKDREIEKLTWVIVLIFLPVIGLVFYAVFGPGVEVTKRNDEKKEHGQEALEL